MKRFMVMFFAVLLSLMFIKGNIFAAEKFGFVSIDRIGEGYTKAKEFMKGLEAKEAAYTSDIEKKRNEVKQFQDKISLLSDKEKDAKAGELETKIKGLQDFARQKQSDLRKEQIDKTIELSKDIKDAITKYAEKEGYTLIFDAAAVAYQPKNMDITDKIIDILNKSYGKK